jgi:hypothetical protein
MQGGWMSGQTAVVSVLMLLLAVSVCAGDVDDCRSTVEIVGCSQMNLTVCPAGDFEWIRDACGAGIDACIKITARHYSGDPIQGIPWTDYWLNSCDPAKQLFLCANFIVADSHTGADGSTTFRGPVAAGGCTSTQGLWWAIQGINIRGPYPDCYLTVCINVIVKSPDLTGAGGKPDGVINLSDLVPFGSSYNKNLGQPGFNSCCDYNDDNKCNLSDFAFFGTHYQHRCS